MITLDVDQLPTAVVDYLLQDRQTRYLNRQTTLDFAAEPVAVLVHRGIPDSRTSLAHIYEATGIRWWDVRLGPRRPPVGVARRRSR